MDKRDLIMSLADSFNDSKDEQSFTIESKQIEKNNYLTLIADNREFVQTHPDYEVFINLLKYYNTKDLNYVLMKLNNNKKKIFVEFSDKEKNSFLNDVRDLYLKLKASNTRNIVFVESIIVDWVNKLFDDSINE